MKSIAKLPKGWKQTVIVLGDDQREEQDIMLTKYFSVGDGCKYLSLDDVKSEISQIQDVLRVKIERTDSFSNIDRENYAEFHVKVEDGTKAPSAAGWVKSRNPRDHLNGVPRFFYNKRVYSGNMNKIIAQVKQELEGVPYVELKIEQNIFDSNRVHDSWWA